MKGDLRQWAKEKYFTKNKKIKGDYFMRTNAEKRVSKIYKLLIVLLIVSMSFTGCMITNTGEGLESGFKFFGSGGDEPSNPFHCGYKTDRTEFDIDNVTIDLYYGVDCCNDDGIVRMGTRIPSFDIYVAIWDEEINKDYVNKYLIRHVEEEFVSVKYNCKVITTQRGAGWFIEEIIYNHHETIKIPKEVFVTEIGCISILIRRNDVKQLSPIELRITSTAFYYKVIGEKVVLSTKPFDK